MIRHLMRLVWNRRRANGLILAELVLSFVVLTAVGSALAHLALLARAPLGFDHRDVWHVNIGVPRVADPTEEQQTEIRARVAGVLRAAQADPAVEAAALSFNIPFGNSRSVQGYWWEGELQRVLYASGSMDLPKVLGLEITAGRWFAPGDAPTEARPVVMSRDLLRLFFGDEDPVGRPVPRQQRDGTPQLATPESPGMQVLGVIDHYRWQGEYGAPHHTMFTLVDPLDTSGSYVEDLLVRMRPGAGASEEEKLLTSLRLAAPGWSFRIDSLESMRTALHRRQLAGPIIGLVVAGFLVLTVALGLVGVLWQNVTRRTQEIGVRRALGATASQVRAQVLGEMIALATAAIGLGTLLVAQAPLLGLFPALTWIEYGLALALATLLVLGLVVVCGLYPSWLATRIGPARALQYE